MALVETEMTLPIDDLEPLAIRESLPLPLEDGQQLYDRLATELLDTARLQQISTLLIREGDVDALYRRVLDAATDLMGSGMASLQMLDHDRGELRLLAFKGFDAAAAAGWQWVNVDSGTTCGAALRSGLRVIAPDVDTCEFVDGEGYRRAGILAVQSTPLLSRSGQLLGMISTHWRAPHQPSERSLALLDVLARQAADLIERTQAEERLRDSEERYRVLFNSIDEGFCVVEMIFDQHQKPVDYRFLHVNPAFGKQTGLQNVQGKTIRELVPLYENHWLETYGKVALTGEPVRFQNRAEQLRRWYDVYAFRFGAAANRQVAVLFNDITERKQSEQHVQFLMNELAHRGQNQLAIIQSIVSQSLAGDRPLAEARNVLMQRLHALGRTQSALMTGRFEGVALTEAVRLEFEAFSERVTAEGPDVTLNPKAGQTLTLLLHELATNAAKYGALADPGGRVAIRWSIEGTGAEARLKFQWREHDGPPVTPPGRQGFGRTILEKVAAQDFGAQPKVEFAPDGLRYEIDAPLSAVAASGPSK